MAKEAPPPSEATRYPGHQERCRWAAEIAANGTFPWVAGALASVDGLWSLDLTAGTLAGDFALAHLLGGTLDAFVYHCRGAARKQVPPRVVTLFDELERWAIQAKEQGLSIVNGATAQLPVDAGRPGCPAVHVRGFVLATGLVVGTARTTIARKDGDAPDQGLAAGLDAELLRAAIDNGRDLIFIMNMTGSSLYISASCAKIYGYRSEEVMNGGPFDYCHPDDVPHCRKQFDRALSDRKPVFFTARVRHRQGHYMTVEVHCAIVSLSDGREFIVGQQWVVDRHENEKDQLRKGYAEVLDRLRQRSRAMSQLTGVLDAVRESLGAVSSHLQARDEVTPLTIATDRIDAWLSGRLATEERQRLTDLRSLLTAGQSSALAGEGSLSARERQVLDLVRQGQASKQIAAQLGISITSVASHRRSIRAKVGAKGSRRHL